MSTFEVKVYKLEILPHPNADRLELAKVGDYVSIVRKDEFKTGDLGVYIPEQAIVPEWILEEMGLKGKLDGPGKDRVKAHRFRSVFSQGLIYPTKGTYDKSRYLEMYRVNQLTGILEKRETTQVVEGDNVAAFLGITKWEPILPQHLKGRASGIAFDITVNYDIENIKKYNSTIEEGEFVGITEKIHGTFVQFGYIPQRLGHTSILHMGCYSVTSKGLGGKGVLLDFEDKSNVYTRTVEDRRYGLGIKLPCIKGEYKDLVGDEPIYFCGEIFGPGIQSGFGYGVRPDDTELRIFDIAYGQRGNIRYFDFNLVVRICKNYELPMVPVLYVGPFSKAILAKCTNGKERVSGQQLHMREGSIVKPLKERRDDIAGRVILKSVSEEYLLRQGKVTEYA